MLVTIVKYTEIDYVNYTSENKRLNENGYDKFVEFDPERQGHSYVYLFKIWWIQTARSNGWIW